jgi:hypothetical protein
MKQIITILLILVISLITNAQENPPSLSGNMTDLEITTEKFISKLQTNFEESPERYMNSKHNDFTLATKTKSTWSKTMTLKSKRCFKNHYQQTVKQRLYFGFHYYATEENCNQAFDTLMKCLGTDCQPIHWGDEKTGLKTTPFIYLKSEKYIIFCKINCEHKNDFWEDIIRLIEADFKSEKFKIITADCGGPLTFITNEINK